MSPGQTGHITGQMGRVPGTDGTHTTGCPPKFFMFIGFSLSPLLDKVSVAGRGVSTLISFPAPPCQHRMLQELRGPAATLFTMRDTLRPETHKTFSLCSVKNLRATTKGQNRLGTVSHFLAIFHTFSHFFRVFQNFSSTTFS